MPARGQCAIPDLRGTWKGESETVVLGGAHPRHPATQRPEPRFTSTPFTLVVQQQNGRRFYGTFSSASSSEPLIAVVARNGTILAVDNDGFANGRLSLRTGWSCAISTYLRRCEWLPVWS